MKQAGLSDDWSDGDDADGARPDAEAVAVAGNGGGHVSEVVDAEGIRFPDADGTVELMVTQVNYSVEGSGSREYPVVHVFGRTPDNEPEHVRVLGFEPYFYAPTESLDDDALDRDVITRTEAGFESIRGDDLTKICTRTPRDVGAIRDDFDHYEADILFPNRLLIDKDIKSGIRVPTRRLDDGTIQLPHDEVEPVEVEADLRVNTFDIEVDDRSGFPEEGEEPIVCLTSHDSYRDEYIAWLYDAPATAEGVESPSELPGYEPFRGDTEIEVRAFDREEAMLDSFVSYIEETDADVLTGWNCLPEDARVQMADGTECEIRNVEVGDEVVGSDDQSSTTTTVTNKWKSEKRIYEFDLVDGTSLRSSGDHRVLVGDDETVDWKEGSDIDPGDYVVKPRRLPVEDTSVPNLSDLIPLENQRFTDKQAVKQFKSNLPYGAISELEAAFDVSKEVLWHPETDVWRPDRCRQAAEKYDISMPDGGRQYRRNGPDVDRQLSKDELYLAGLILTDGTMSRDGGVRFYNTETALHQQFPGDNELTPDGTGCYSQNVLNYALMHAFNGLGIPIGDKNAGPVDLSPVYGMPEPYIARFLAGAIDGDGNVSSYVTLAAENQSIGEWYVRLFRRLGIYAQQRSNVVRVANAKLDVERLKRNVLPYMNHPEKVERLKRLEGGKSGRTENIPYALFETEVGTDARRIGRDKHRRGISLKRHETISESWDEYVFVEVEDVGTTGTETTYDIETTTHDFVAEGCLVHNCDDFDIPYLLDRLDVLNPAADQDLSVDRLSRIDEVWRSGWGGPDVKGRVVFDLLYAYKRTQFTELESYRLDAVGELELDAGKERYTGDIGDLWEQEPERLLEYNVRDVELCVEIDRKQDIIAFWDEVRTFVGCKLEDAPTPGDTVDQYILHEAHNRFALPSKGQADAEDYEGGAVFDPITGVKENITVLDLKSLYPMCMTTINASPETKVDPETHDGETFEAPNGTHFRREPDGVIREMIDTLLSEREEKKSLRNDHDPDTSAYEQYDRQQQSVKVIMNCFTPDTEVLTPNGVRNICNLDVGDAVYSIDPDTLRMEAKPVEETHEYPEYRGDLVDIQTSKTDFRVTPNHRMLVRKNSENGATWDGYRFIEAGDLDEYSNYELPHDWSVEHGDAVDEVDLTEHIDGDYEVWVRPSIHGHTFTAELGWTPRRVPKADRGDVGYVFTAEEFEAHREYIESVCEASFIHQASGRKWVPRTYDGDDFLELLAWYITEGNVYTSSEKQYGEHVRGSATTVKIAQNAVPDGGENAVVDSGENAIPDGGDGGESDHARIGSLLDRLGLDYYVDDRAYQFTSRLLGGFLERLCGEDSFTKRIPDLVFEASEAQKRQFLATLVAGDGDRQVGSWRYTTSSERLRDDVLRLCTHLGKTASYNHDSGSWRVYCTEEPKNSLRMHRSGGRSTADDGVYCVTVADNQTLLAGRNGTFQWTGNSLYGVLGWDRFRLYDKEMGAAVTATGREVIEHTAEAANELDKEVIYGDTDSVMLELGHGVSKDEAIEQSFELEEYINDSYDEFAVEQLDAAQHRFQIEFEKLYRRFFQAGKKKRYAGHIIWKEGKDVDDIDITGFEYKRSDIAAITKEVQRRVIEMIVYGEDSDDIADYLNGVIEDFETGEVPVDEIGIPGGIGKRLDAYDTDTAQVRGAKYANEFLGTNFGRGSKPKRLYLRKVHPSWFREMEAQGYDPQRDPLYSEFKRDPDVICIEYDDQLPEAFEVDWDKMLTKTLKGPIERIIEALGMSWDEVKSGQEQTGLGSFT